MKQMGNSKKNIPRKEIAKEHKEAELKVWMKILSTVPKNCIVTLEIFFIWPSGNYCRIYWVSHKSTRLQGKSLNSTFNIIK